MHDYEKTDNFVELPMVKTVFPRQKAIPKPKPLTRWEKFAKENQIVKRKRNSKVYDEVTGTYVRRWGYKSIKKLQQQRDIVYEVKEGEDPYADPFQRKSLEK